MGSSRQLGLGTKLAAFFVRDPLIYLYTGVLGTGSLISSLFDRSGRLQHGFARLWSRLILKTAACPLTVEGIEKLDTTQPAVYAVNHISALDIPAVYAGLPFQFRIMAKQELFRLPFLGWHLKRSGQIPIDRDSAHASMRSLSRGAAILKGGMPLVAFPEGGRSTDGRIQPFLGGVFYLAIKAQMPIVPMALVGTFEALPMNHYVIAPHPFRLIAGEPISTEGYSPRDMEKLSAKVREAIENLYYPNAYVSDPRKEQPSPVLAPEQ